MKFFPQSLTTSLSTTNDFVVIELLFVKTSNKKNRLNVNCKFYITQISKKKNSMITGLYFFSSFHHIYYSTFIQQSLAMADRNFSHKIYIFLIWIVQFFFILIICFFLYMVLLQDEQMKIINHHNNILIMYISFKV